MPGASAEAPLPDPGGLNQFRDRQEGAIFVQVEGQAGETIWGTGVYTNDSPLEAVVVHAGLLRVGEKGIVKVTWLPGQQAYSGSTQNGVTSHPYGEWHGSYRVELVRKIPPPAPTPDPGQLQNYRTQVGQRFVFEVTGSAEGPVWGTDIYTDDSRLATAAVHAGLLQVGQRGRLRVTILPGQASYPGSTRNGVTSAEWQQWAGSYRIERVAP